MSRPTRLVSLLSALGSLLPRRTAPRNAGRLVRPWRDDFTRTWPTVGLTPQRLLSFLQAADAGTPQLQFELFAEMLQRWPRLAAVENTRRLALTGLDWEILPAAGGAGRPTGRAPAAADYCRATLEGIDSFRDVLGHLATAIGHGLAVAELIWQDGHLVDLEPVPHTRLAADPHEPWRLRLRTEENAGGGLALDEFPNKWLVHTPRPTPGRHFDGGLLRASALLFLAQNLSFKDWLVYAQLAGTPVRVAQYEPGLPEGDKRELLLMLKALGTEAVATFSKRVDLKLIENSRSGAPPYPALQEYCNTEVTILWLGQHLTTDIRHSGSRAAAEIHDRVREDLLVDDIADEGRTLRRDLLTPLVRARFGDGVPPPYFRRSLIQSVDTKVLADTLAVAARDLRLPVPARWVYRALGIPEPQAGEAVLAASVAPQRHVRRTSAAAD